MPPAKRATAKSNVVSFKPKKVKVHQFDAFGRLWDVKPANVTLLTDFEENESIASMLQFVVGHIVKAQREDFLVAFAQEEDMDLENMVELSKAVQQAAYPDIPT